MDEEYVKPGDVLLIKRANPGPVSKTIRALTDSAYTHCAVAMGDNIFADSNDVGDRGNELEVRKLTLDEIVEKVPPDEGNVISLYRYNDDDWAESTEKVSERLEAKYQELLNEDAEFSVGALVALGALRSISWPSRLKKIVDTFTRDSAKRYQHSLAVAISEGGGSQLTCSEFVYRMLKAAGAPPIDFKRVAMPIHDLGVPVDSAYPTPLGRAVLQRINGWVRGTLKENHLGDEQLGEVRDVFNAANAHFESGEKLERVELADFVVPADFTNVATQIATLQADGTWEWHRNTS